MRRSWWRLAILVLAVTAFLVDTGIAQEDENGGSKSAAAPKSDNGGGATESTNGDNSEGRAQSNGGGKSDEDEGDDADDESTKTKEKDPVVTDFPKLPDNGIMGGADGSLGWQECFEFLKNCRDEKCAYRNYTADCIDGGRCTCVGPSILGADATTNYVRIERFTFALLIVVIGVAFGTWSL